jgi:hypothetical protein
VFENRVLRRIFGPKNNEVTGRRKLHNVELRHLYSSPSIIRRRIRWAGQVARIREERNAYRLLVGKARGKETARKTKTWVDG